MTRREFLGYGLAVLAFAAAWPQWAGADAPDRPPGRRPNVVFILTDDNAFDGVGYSSGGKFLTPQIDALARGGVILDNFNCPASVCTPSRYSYLTGVHAGNCSWPKFREVWAGKMYCLNWFTNFEPGRRTIGSVLQAAGYKTGYTGKWHNGGVENAALTFPELTPNADPAAPAVAAALRKRYDVIRKTIRDHGFDFAESVCWGNADMRPLQKLHKHNLEWIAKGARDFLDQRAADRQPFYLQVNFSVPHGPHHIVSLETDPRICEFGYTEETLTGFMPPRRSVVDRVKQAGLVANHDTVGRLWLDDAVGAVVAKLKEHGQFENTLIFVISDNGDKQGKGSCYELGVRLPALAHWPAGLTAGRRCEALLANIDLLPTVAAVCGAPVPADLPLDGANRWAQITGAADEREDLFLEIGYSRGVKTKRWKYIATRYPQAMLDEMASGKLTQAYTLMGKAGGDYLISSVHPGYYDQDQLYDLVNDPGETKNLAGAQPDRVREMQARLRRHLDRIPYPYPLDRQPFLDSAAYRRLAAAAAADDQILRAPWYVQETTLTR